MSDAMVTARMSQAKKEAGNRVLDELGMNASRVINDLYDYIVANKKLPAEMTGEPADQRSRAERLREAAEWVDSLVIVPADNRFAHMTAKEAKMERLVARGLIKREDLL